MKYYAAFTAAAFLYQLAYLLFCIRKKNKRAAIGSIAALAFTAAACLLLAL